MLKNLWNLSKLNNGFVIISLLCFSLAIADLVRAEYKKPQTKNGNDAPSSSSTGVAATRGICDPASTNLKANTPTLTAIAPYGHVGQSVSSNPTFNWYIPDRESYPVEFWLYEFNPDRYGGKGEQIYQTKLSSSVGMMTHSLPQEVNLAAGKTYIWQVAVICNPNSPSQSLVVNNRIEIVEIDSGVTSQLNQTQDPIAKAKIYAQSGLWYDALAKVALQNDPHAQNATVELIEQLATMETDENLQQIANSLLQSE